MTSKGSSQNRHIAALVMHWVVTSRPPSSPKMMVVSGHEEGLLSLFLFEVLFDILKKTCSEKGEAQV